MRRTADDVIKAGGTGPTYPSLTVEADSGRAEGSRWRGVLALYASPHGGPPALEVRVKTFCRTPPHDHQQYRSRLTEGLHIRDIPRLDRERACPACGRKSRAAS